MTTDAFDKFAAPPEIVPSILAAPMHDMKRAMAELGQDTGVRSLHFDIMDGHFVPPISFGASFISAVRPLSSALFEAHLMVTNPEGFLSDLQVAGVNAICYHAELPLHHDRLIRHIQEMGIFAGVVVNPATPVESLLCLLEIVDFVLLMSVNPGYGGQSFIPYVTKKVRRLISLRETLGADFAIEIDGGVKLHNAGALIEAGADKLVAGSAYFGIEDPSKRSASLLGESRS